MSVVHPNTYVYVLTDLLRDGCGFVLRSNKSVTELRVADRKMITIGDLTQHSDEREYLSKMEAKMLMASFYTQHTCEVSSDSALKQSLRYIL